ncbi:MAG: hypothetical protein GY765_29395 [bacterium]|nr:hypothetical protein [bacterium]
MKCLAQLYEKLDLTINKSVIEVKNHTDWEKNLPADLTLLPKTIEQLNIIKPDAFYQFNLQTKERKNNLIASSWTYCG